jgi:tRNA (guanine37-N1)-methyltransferase
MDILSCVPGLLYGPLNYSILKRAQEKQKVSITIHNLHDYATGGYQQTDDYPFGGGAGMVMRIEPIARCIRKLEEEKVYDEKIFLTPDGQLLTQELVNQLSLCKNLLLLAGHYKGVDQRVRDCFITREISIGDYVLSGGELPALVLIDAIVRLLPGVLGDEMSALTDSFQDALLAPPVYTRPADFEGLRVPEILLTGHRSKIEEWRLEQALLKTQQLRPDLYHKFIGESGQ